MDANQREYEKRSQAANRSGASVVFSKRSLRLLGREWTRINANMKNGAKLLTGPALRSFSRNEAKGFLGREWTRINANMKTKPSC